MNETNILQAYEAYGYSVTELLPAISGYRNTCYPALTNKGSVNLIVYKKEAGILARIKRTNLLGTELRHRGLAVRSPADHRILRLSQNSELYASVYHFLPGKTIPWEAYTKKHIKLLGWVLSDFHAAAHSIEKTIFPAVTDEYTGHLARMQTYFMDSNVKNALLRKLGLRVRYEFFDTAKTLLEAVSKLSDQTILHMDLLRGNVLFDVAQSASVYSIEDVELTGVIDLEKASVGHPLFDVARTLAFLEVDCSSKSASSVRRYLIDSGYNKRGNNTVSPTNIGGLDLLVTAKQLFLMYDFYKFLRQNPYEDLLRNYHFIRTRDILLAYNLLY